MPLGMHDGRESIKREKKSISSLGHTVEVTKHFEEKLMHP